MKKIIGVIVGIVIIGAVVNGINKNNTPKTGKSDTGQSEQSTKVPRSFDAEYGPHARNTMHVVLPTKTSSDTPVVMVIHGGAWISGDKKDMVPIQTKLAEKGIASAAINYRYASSSVHYPQLMSDVDTAVDYVVDHSDDWNVSSDKLVMSGISAGAHMAMLYSYAYDNDKRVDAVISLAGPTDFKDTKWLDQIVKVKMIGGLNNMVGESYVAGKPLPPVYTTVSPIDHIRKVPTLLVHGTKDTIVLYSQAQSMDRALSQANVPHKLVTIPNVNHDIGLGNIKTTTMIFNEFLKWVEMYAK